MPATLSSSALAVDLRTAAKVVSTARATESAEFQAVKAEHQKANDIYRSGKGPEDRMQLLIKAKANQNDESEAPQKWHESELAQASVL
jgi:hypothetical protein